jgi:hypothetical protein
LQQGVENSWKKPTLFIGLASCGNSSIRQPAFQRLRQAPTSQRSGQSPSLLISPFINLNLN